MFLGAAITNQGGAGRGGCWMMQGVVVLTVISFQTFCEGGHAKFARRLWEIGSEGVTWAIVCRCFVFSFLKGGGVFLVVFGSVWDFFLLL